MSPFAKRRHKNRRLAMAALQRDTPRLALLVYVRSAGHCWHCGATTPLAEGSMDHLVPVSSGGETRLSNLVWSCVPCNSAKDQFSLDYFRTLRGGEPFWGERCQNAEVQHG